MKRLIIRPARGARGGAGHDTAARRRRCATLRSSLGSTAARSSCCATMRSSSGSRLNTLIMPGGVRAGIGRVTGAQSQCCAKAYVTCTGSAAGASQHAAAESVKAIRDCTSGLLCSLSPEQQPRCSPTDLPDVEHHFAMLHNYSLCRHLVGMSEAFRYIDHRQQARRVNVRCARTEQKRHASVAVRSKAYEGAVWNEALRRQVLHRI